MGRIHKVGRICKVGGFIRWEGFVRWEGFIRWEGHLDPQKSNKQKTKPPSGPFLQSPHPDLTMIFLRVEVDVS